MQCNWNHVLSVDPNNANVIYAGGVGLWRGTITCEHTRKDDNKNLVLVDRCIDWVEVSQTLAPHPPTPRLRRIGIHVDQHAMEWTADARRLVVGNDGGVWSTTDSGRSWNAHNHGLSVMQFYRGAVADATDGSGPIMLGGTQDNGVARWRGGSWDWVLGGDGGAALISKKRPDTHWAVTTTSVLFGKRMRRSVDGKQFPFANDPSLIDDTEPSLDVLMKPLAACPWNDDVVVVAGQGSLSALAPKLKALWKSESFFTTPASPTWRPNFTEEQVDIDAQGLISAVAFAASGTSCDTYAFGTKAGAVWLTTKGGKFWCHIGTQLEVPTSTRITGMGFDPSGRLYVSLVDLTSKRFGLVAHTDAPIPACVKDELIKPSWHYVPLVRSTDQNPGCFPDSTAGGPREQHASPACPTGTRIMDDREHVNTIALHPRVPGLMYAGTNAGVWVSHDHGATWTRHDHSTYGMPNVPVLDIKISPSGRHVVAFTYGRGAFLWEGRGWCDGQPSSAIGTNFRPCPR
jgi:hypothetical protein